MASLVFFSYIRRGWNRYKMYLLVYCKTLRIAFITDKMSPFYVGGYETRYWELAKCLASEYEVHVFTSCPADTVIDGVHFHKVAPHISYVDRYGYRIISKDIFYSLLLFKDLIRKMDFIDCNATPFIHIPVAKILSKTWSGKLAVTVHEAFSGSLKDYFDQSTGWKHGSVKWITKSFLPYRFIRMSLQLPDDVFAVSSITQRALEADLGLDNVHLVPNGIDLGRIPDNADSERAGNIITYLGRLSPEKNLSELLFAVEYMKNNGFPYFECRIIGMGAEYEMLKQLCRERDIEDRVHFYGHVNEKTKYELLGESDVFVLPSSREGFSIASLEAMGCYLPVVAARSSHPESLGVFGHLTEGYNGLGYPVGDYKELAVQIGSLLSDDERRTRMGLNARETAESFSWNQIISLYKKVIES